MTDPTLRPCPFCGPEAEELPEIGINNKANYQVNCALCGARGPWSPTRKEAIESWNLRAPAPASGELRERVGEIVAEIRRCTDFSDMEGIEFILDDEEASDAILSLVSNEMFRSLVERTAKALDLRGPWNGAETWDSWHDIPERVAALKAKANARPESSAGLVERVAEILDEWSDAGCPVASEKVAIDIIRLLPGDGPEPSADLVERVARELFEALAADEVGTSYEEVAPALRKRAASLCRLLPGDEWVRSVHAASRRIWAASAPEHGLMMIRADEAERIMREEILKERFTPPAASGEKGDGNG